MLNRSVNLLNSTPYIVTIDPKAFMQSITEAFEFRAEDLSLDTRFQEHDAWDSLVSVSTVAMIYAEFDTQVSGDELVACDTLGALKKLIESKLAKIA